ncbi:MAG: hypothetical protein GXP31_10355 [Kiritimatiellaeota bacterium]|nr:hypothetical protein [Kiritimatiellota bacterium]
MRDFDPEQEQAFFAAVDRYFDLEKRPNRRYGTHEYTLERMTPLARAAGHPEGELRIVHVAGTKGKGSTAFFLSALLESAGHRCGVFSSPHLATVRERFQIAGDLVSYTDLLDATRRLDRELTAADLTPTLFEFMTLLALRLFVGAGCEFAVLETGIGGTLDATNYVPQKVCTILTPISFDHMELLGDTIAEIAGQKAGILRPGVPAVCAPQPFVEARRVIEDRARELAAPFIPGARRHDSAVAAYSAVQALAPFLQDNFRTALQACDVMEVSPRPEQFRMPQLRARCECVRREPPVVLDGAHNADSAQQLVRALGELFPNTRFVVVLGVVPGKDILGILAPLREVASRFIFTHPLSWRGSALESLEAAAREMGVRYDVRSGLKSVRDVPADKPLLFTGSFFTALIGESLFSPLSEGGRREGI